MIGADTRTSLRRIAASVAVVIALVALAGCGGSTVSDVPIGTPPKVGDVFPYTRYLSGSGEVVDLDVERQDAQVLLVFMRGFDGMVCPYCTRQTATIISRYDDLQAAGFKVYIVYPGPESSVPMFVEEVGERVKLEGDAMPVPLLLDVDLRAVRTLGIPAKLAKPATFVIDRDGKLLYSYIGESMNDRPDLDTVLQAVRPTVVETPAGAASPDEAPTAAAGAPTDG